MTELVNSLKEKAEDITHENLREFAEITILVLTFVFCVVAVSPIV